MHARVSDGSHLRVLDDETTLTCTLQTAPYVHEIKLQEETKRQVREVLAQRFVAIETSDNDASDESSKMETCERTDIYAEGRGIWLMGMKVFVIELPNKCWTYYLILEHTA